MFYRTRGRIGQALTMTDALIVRSEAQLLAALPSLLGYVPRESVVAVAVTQRGVVDVIVRVDRADLRAADSAEPLARAVSVRMARTAPERVLVVTYSAESVRFGDSAAWALRAQLRNVVGHVDLWAVTDGKYYSPGCERWDCCPEYGTDLPPTPLPTASLRIHGRVTHGEARAGATAARETSEDLDYRATMVALWLRALDDDRFTLKTADSTALLTALGNVHVRDACLVSIAAQPLANVTNAEVAAMMRGVLDSTARVRPNMRQLASAHALLARLSEKCAGETLAAVHSMQALLLWWEGRPHEAGRFAVRALTACSSYSLARLLREAVQRGVEPGWRATG